MATVSPDERGKGSPGGQKKTQAEDLTEQHSTQTHTGHVVQETYQFYLAEPRTGPVIGKTPVIDQSIPPLEVAVEYTDSSVQPATALAITAESTIRIAKPVQRRRLPRATIILLVVLASLALLSVGIAGTGYYYYVTRIQRPLKQFIRPVSRGLDEVKATVVQAPTYDMIRGQSWNILLLGSDNDNKYTFPQILTQVMMIVHVDTINNTVTMVSIPRDSWVPVANINGMHKIDQAFLLGAQNSNDFEDGVRTARETIEQDYGISIDRYAWVGLDGFSKVIDTLGGVDIDVLHPMVDDDYPDDVGKGSDPKNPQAYTRLLIAPGPQHLNGQEALNYVRTRHSDLVGDLGRTQRQQQVLAALKLKLNITSVISNLSQLFSDLNGSVYTDLTADEMLAFANFSRMVPSQNITHLTLGTGQGLTDYGDPTTINDPTLGMDQDVIIPHCATIQPVINRIFQLGTDMQSCHIGS